MALRPRRGALILEISRVNKLQGSPHHGALSQDYSLENLKRSRPEIGLITVQCYRLFLLQKFSPIIARLANLLRSRGGFQRRFAISKDFRDNGFIAKPVVKLDECLLAEVRETTTLFKWSFNDCNVNKTSTIAQRRLTRHNNRISPPYPGYDVALDRVG